MRGRAEPVFGRLGIQARVALSRDGFVQGHRHSWGSLGDNNLLSVQ